MAFRESKKTGNNDYSFQSPALQSGLATSAVSPKERPSLRVADKKSQIKVSRNRNMHKSNVVVHDQNVADPTYSSGPLSQM